MLAAKRLFCDNFVKRLGEPWRFLKVWSKSGVENAGFPAFLPAGVASQQRRRGF
jgi:hypothetical protein